VSKTAWICVTIISAIALMTVSDGMQAWATIAAEAAEQACYEFVKNINCGGGK
jgi:hypothetical protein